jgi:molecular chaperone Hsp33
MESGDRILRTTGETVEFRLVLVDCTRAANHIADRHQARGFARQLLGEAVAASLLQASGLKGPGTVQLRFDLSGDITRLAADATPLGLVRAMIPQEELRRTENFEPMILPRTLTVRQLDRDGLSLSEGIVEMVSPDLSESLTHFLRQSEQSRSRIRVGAPCETAESLRFAGGFRVEGFPGLKEEDWARLETAQRPLSLADFERPEGGLRLESLLAKVAGPFAARVHREFDVEPFCPCSEAGVLRALEGLGRSELENLYFEGAGAELFCEFCRKRYPVSAGQLRKLMENEEPPETSSTA